jgi:endo-1,4-beta-mannosidase
MKVDDSHRHKYQGHAAMNHHSEKAVQGLLFMLTSATVLGIWTGDNSLVIAKDRLALEKIRVDAGRRCFVTEDGKTFIPFGVNYFRPGTGWAPQVWKKFDAAAVREDFRRMKELGINCVRVFLTFDSFYREPGRLETFGLDRWEEFLSIAEEYGIYVHPTGPDHWEGLPAWARRDTISDPDAVSALVEFWKLFASRYRDRPVIFAYDLRNEPSVPWENSELLHRWADFLHWKYRSPPALAKAWGVEITEEAWNKPRIPPLDGPRQAILDYQNLREEVADEWTRRQVEAIKSVDPQALVTVGLIQWSVPVLLPDLRSYSAFRPTRQAQFLDFMEIHFYPLALGFYEYRGEEDRLANLAYAESVVREVARSGKPVVVAEFGWYGGGQLTINNGRHPPASEEQQAAWCRELIAATQGLACGWLNWGLYDHPEARDVTQLTGLFRVDGTPKAWARKFRELSAEIATCCVQLAEWEQTHPRPAFDFDQAICDPNYALQFRQQYLERFRATK